MAKGFEFTAVPSMHRVAFAFAEYADEITDWKRALKDVEKLFYAHERNLFDTSGTGKSGKKWKRWKALSTNEPPKGGYRAYKNRVRPGRQILTFDGALRKAATGGPGSIKGKVTKDSILVGIDPGSEQGVIARAHTFGVREAGRPYLPKRPPVRFDGTITSDSRGVTFGYAVSQIMQSFLVFKRKQAMRKDPEVLKRIQFGKTYQHHRARVRKILAKYWR